MENGLSSPRPDSFPAGLRVLVVDDDLTWLKILERMLKKCSYDVTTCNLARDALRLLREKKDGFDIVISDVNMPDMDGFKLLERVGLEMDLPVIMMSVDGETARVMKGVQHGACDYLLKPIRMKELRNIWQHVFRKKIHEVRDFESHDSIEDIHLMGNGLDPSDDGYFVKGADMNSVKKRRGVDHKHEDRDFGDPTFVKKARVVWSLDLHQKFVKAVNQIGFDKVGPKKILDLMNVPWLTRENVASHLQKYRLYLDRLQKENGQKASSSGLNHSDFSSNDSAQSFGVQKSSTMLQNDVVSSSNVFVKNQNYKLYESKVSGITSGPLTEPKKAADGDLPNFHASSNSEMSIDHSFGLVEPDVNYIAVGSSSQNSSKGKVPKMQFKHKKQPPLKLEDGLSNVALRVQQNHLHLNHLQPAPSKSHEPSLSTATDEGRPSMIKKMYARTKNIFSSEVTSTGGTTQASEPISTSALNMRNSGFCKGGINDLELLPKDLLSRSDSGFASLDESLPTCWLQGDCSTMNRGLENIEFLDYYDPGLLSGGQLHHDGSAVDIGYLYDTIEYPVAEQGLFLA